MWYESIEPLYCGPGYNNYKFLKKAGFKKRRRRSRMEPASAQAGIQISSTVLYAFDAMGVI